MPSSIYSYYFVRCCIESPRITAHQREERSTRLVLCRVFMMQNGRTCSIYLSGKSSTYMLQYRPTSPDRRQDQSNRFDWFRLELKINITLLQLPPVSSVSSSQYPSSYSWCPQVCRIQFSFSLSLSLNRITELYETKIKNQIFLYYNVINYQQERSNTSHTFYYF